MALRSEDPGTYPVVPSHDGERKCAGSICQHLPTGFLFIVVCVLKIVRVVVYAVANRWLLDVFKCNTVRPCLQCAPIERV